MKIWNRKYFIFDLWKNCLDKISHSIDCRKRIKNLCHDIMKAHWLFEKKMIFKHTICLQRKWNCRRKKMTSMLLFDVMFFMSKNFEGQHQSIRKRDSNTNEQFDAHSYQRNRSKVIKFTHNDLLKNHYWTNSEEYLFNCSIFHRSCI